MRMKVAIPWGPRIRGKCMRSNERSAHTLPDEHRHGTSLRSIDAVAIIASVVMETNKMTTLYRAFFPFRKLSARRLKY
jgi:hypothetical protein